MAKRNPIAARQAKIQKRNVRKAAASKRTKVYQSLKSQGITSAIGVHNMNVTVPVDQNISRSIGHTKLNKTKKLTIISRRSQPAFKIKVKVPRLDKKVAASGNVASSWISYLEWNPINKTVTMGLLDGWNYVYKMSFKEYQGWYYAHSKGTYWWVVLRRKYNNKYIRKYKL